MEPSTPLGLLSRFLDRDHFVLVDGPQERKCIDFKFVNLIKNILGTHSTDTFTLFILENGFSNGREAHSDYGILTRVDLLGFITRNGKLQKTITS